MLVFMMGNEPKSVSPGISSADSLISDVMKCFVWLSNLYFCGNIFASGETDIGKPWATNTREKDDPTVDAKPKRITKTLQKPIQTRLQR
jgi:hypothetical protein